MQCVIIKHAFKILEEKFCYFLFKGPLVAIMTLTAVPIYISLIIVYTTMYFKTQTRKQAIEAQEEEKIVVETNSPKQNI